ncbi:hypothetical protein CEN39_06920 [Fischerella thermalis CCMEE 5201]|jgi:uncharacterized protein YggE|nr:hypothetical protein CEN39_06920 [Fischerella thermalis CCMEE 5201]
MNKPTLLGSQLLTGNLWKSLSFAMLVCITFTQPVLAQEKQRMLRTLTVTGRGVESIPATLAQVVLGVEVQAKTAQEAQQEAARRSSAVVALLKTRNVEKLQTTGITLNPVYSYKDNIQRLTGYSASNTVSFRIATDKAGQLLDEAVKAGATQISGISFVATDEAIAQAQKQALTEATQEAQQQAEAVFGALGFQRKEVVSIQINGASAPPPPPRPMFRADAAQTANASTPVEGGEQQVEASVTLEISY